MSQVSLDHPQASNATPAVPSPRPNAGARPGWPEIIVGLIVFGAVARGGVLLYAANWERSMYDDFVAGVEQALREFDMPRPPAALIGVGILFEKSILIEAEVTAVIDRVDPLPNAYGGA